jgi:hypothetical protein
MTDRDASDAGNVVAGIEGVPVVAEIGLEPARRSQGRIVAANASAFVECLPRRLRQPSVLVAEGDVAMNVVADGLDAGHTSCRSRRDRARSECPPAHPSRPFLLRVLHRVASAHRNPGGFAALESEHGGLRRAVSPRFNPPWIIEGSRLFMNWTCWMQTSRATEFFG